MNFKYRISKLLTSLFYIRHWVFDIKILNLIILTCRGNNSGYLFDEYGLIVFLDYFSLIKNTFTLINGYPYR